MIRKGINGLAYKLGIKYLLAQIRAAAEGRLGPEWKARYWALAGWKTRTGVILSLLAAALVAIDQPEAAMALGTAAGILVEAGLLDKAWRNYIPDGLRNSRVYAFLASNAELVGFAFAATAAWVNRCEGEPCRYWAMGLAAAAAAAIQLGLLDAAWRSHPPAPTGKKHALDFDEAVGVKGR